MLSYNSYNRWRLARVNFLSACWYIKKIDYQKSDNTSKPWGFKVSNMKMHIKQMINIISTMTVFIVRNFGIKPVTAKQISFIEENRLRLSKKNFVSIVLELNIKPLSALVIVCVRSARESTITQCLTKQNHTVNYQ